MAVDKDFGFDLVRQAAFALVIAVGTGYVVGIQSAERISFLQRDIGELKASQESQNKRLGEVEKHLERIATIVEIQGRRDRR